MREIKFRAWHKEKKIMASVGDWNWTGKVHVSYKSGPDKSGYFFGGNNVGDGWEKDEYELMQYTGLKDKNGKEIYEGDVVTDGHSNLIVEWWGESCEYILSHKGGLQSLTISCSEWAEIIGNIYKTPNLLKL